MTAIAMAGRPPSDRQWEPTLTETVETFCVPRLFAILFVNGECECASSQRAKCKICIL